MATPTAAMMTAEASIVNSSGTFTSADRRSPVDLDSVLWGIAHHDCPDDLVETVIPCVVGKRVFHAPDGPYSGTTELSADDVSHLTQFLAAYAADLPILCEDMSDGQIEQFLRAFRAIEGRPMRWEPCLRSRADRQGEVSLRRLDIIKHQRSQIGEASKRGEVRLFDLNRVPQGALHSQVQSLIPREDARAYLDRVGLSLEEILGERTSDDNVQPVAASLADADCKVECSTDAGSVKLAETAEREPLASDPGHSTEANSAEPSDVDKPTKRRREPRKSDEDKALAVFYYNERRFAEGAIALDMPRHLFTSNARGWALKAASAANRSEAERGVHGAELAVALGATGRSHCA